MTKSMSVCHVSDIIYVILRHVGVENPCKEKNSETPDLMSFLTKET